MNSREQKLRRAYLNHSDKSASGKKIFLGIV